MRQMQPALGCLDGMRTLTVLHLRDGMVVTRIDDLLLFHLGMGDIIHQRPADATARTRIDEAILRTGIESVLPVHELRVEHHVTLLRTRLQIGQPLPRL